MKKQILVSGLGALLFLHAPFAMSGDVSDVSSLRGNNALDAIAKPIEKKKQIKTADGIERNWELQPPSIPHDISKEYITVKVNTCMKCHSKADHEKEKAPEIPKSHYIDRNMKVLAKPSSRRWFCNQCHAPQADVKPLVGNAFKPNSIKLDNLLMKKAGE